MVKKKLTKAQLKAKQEAKQKAQEAKDRRLEIRLNPRKEFISMMEEEARRADDLYEQFGHGA